MAEIELREVPLFREMDEQEVAGIRDIMEEMKFNEGQVIIREVKKVVGGQEKRTAGTKVQRKKPK